MSLSVEFGLEHVEVEIPAGKRVPLAQQKCAPDVPDPITATREALEAPHEFPALRKALTPDDHVAIVVDESLPRVAAPRTSLASTPS